MASDEYGDKTELPTERRRTEAREKGNIPRSVDLNAAGLMLAAAIAINSFGPPLTKSLSELMHASIQNAGNVQLSRGDAMRMFWELAKFSAVNVLPVMLAMAAAALALNLAQVGFLLAPQIIQPQLSRINPLDGAKRLLSIRAVMKLGVSLGKLAVVIGVAGISISHFLPQFLALLHAPAGPILGLIESSVVRLAFQVSSALVTLAALDYLFQRWKHEQELRMTKQEVREEMKQMEGDPHIRQRRREAHRKLVSARELQKVRNADVVITNPTEIAVAIKYDPTQMPAPIVVAKGMGEIAARIRQIAAEHNVPIIERKPLARALYRDVKVGHAIPVDMYGVFVEIMAYVYRITGRTPQGLK